MATFSRGMHSSGFHLPTVHFDFCGPFVHDKCTFTPFIRLCGGKEKRARTFRRHTNSTNPMINQPNACWKQEKIKRAFTRLVEDLGRSN